MGTSSRLQDYVKLDPWQNAQNRFLDRLSEEDKRTFNAATIEDLEMLYYRADNLRTAYQTNNLQRMIQPLMDGLKQYKDALNAFVGISSVLKPIWGSVLVVLTIASAYEKYFEQLTTMFGKIGRSLPILKEYGELFKEDLQLFNHLTNAYYVILNFCIEVKEDFNTQQISMAKPKAGEQTKGWKLLDKTLQKVSQSRTVTTKALSTISNRRLEDYIKDLEKENKAAKARTQLIHMQQEQKHQQGVARHQKEQSRRHLLKLLPEVDIVNKHDRTSRRRQEGTANWIFEDAAFIRFDNRLSSACLCCYGILGSGKTYVMSSLIDHAVQENTEKGALVCYHYFDDMDKRSLSASALYSAILKQLIKYKGWYSDLEESLESLMQAGSTIVQDDVLRDLLVHTCRKHLERILVILDAIDEPHSMEQENIIAFIEQLLTTQGLVVKVVTTCREGEQRLRMRLSVIQTDEIFIRAGTVAGDIDRIIQQTMSQWLPKFGVIETDVRDIIRKALEPQADGMFLLVRCQLDELGDAVSIDNIMSILDDLPRDVVTAYDRALQRKCMATHDKTVPKLARKVFKWLACALRPLTLTELLEAVIINPGDQTFPSHRVHRDSGHRLIDACGNLVIHDTASDIITLAHSSVRQYLLDHFHQDLERGFHFSLYEAERFVCGICFTYLSFTNFEAQVVQKQTPLNLDSGAIGHAVAGAGSRGE